MMTQSQALVIDEQYIAQSELEQLFNNETTMVMVTQAIMAQGEFTGVVRGHERR